MGLKQNLAVWESETFGCTLVDVTIGDMLDERRRTHPHSIAAIFDDPESDVSFSWTYAELGKHVDRLAKSLMRRGIDHGSRVAVFSQNSFEWMLLEYALASIGAILVTVNTANRLAELRYVLRQSRASMLVTSGFIRGHSVERMVAELWSERDMADLSDLCQLVLIGPGSLPESINFSDLLTSEMDFGQDEYLARKAAIQPNDVVQIQYTSGTTGVPKGAMLSHHGTLNNAILMARRAGFSANDKMISAMPFFHTAGCVCNVLSMLAAGGCLINMPIFDAGRMLELIETYNPTIISAVPTMLVRLLEELRGQPRAVDLSTIRIAFVGGTSIPASLMREVKDVIGADPLLIMGMTETSPLITQTIPDDDFETKIASAGTPLPFTEIKIIGNDGLPLRCGETGELLIRGYNVFQGYFEMPEQTEAAIDQDGWMHSGDLATLDSSGYLRIVGRIKDMIIRGGENLFPAEIEDFLVLHHDVSMAQVVGVADPEMGEEAFAFVVPRAGATLTEQGLRDFMRANFSRHKTPRYILIIDELPLTANGKVKKFELRDIAVSHVTCIRQREAG